MTDLSARLEDMMALLDTLSRDDDPRKLAEDEHARYQLYVDALRAAPIGHERHILEVVLRDPDRAMREATIVVQIDHVGRELPSASHFSEWWERQGWAADGIAFASRRASQWTLLKQLMDGQEGD